MTKRHHVTESQDSVRSPIVGPLEALRTFAAALTQFKEAARSQMRGDLDDWRKSCEKRLNSYQRELGAARKEDKEPRKQHTKAAKAPAAQPPAKRPPKAATTTRAISKRSVSKPHAAARARAAGRVGKAFPQRAAHTDSALLARGTADREDTNVRLRRAIAFIESRGFEVDDKRQKGGGIWVYVDKSAFADTARVLKRRFGVTCRYLEFGRKRHADPHYQVSA